MSIRYLMLMRHASHEVELETGAKRLSNNGLREVKQVAGRLGEYLIHARHHRWAVGSGTPSLGVVIAAPTDEARATARALLKELKHFRINARISTEPSFLSPDLCPAASPYFFHWRRTSRFEVARFLDTAIQRILAIGNSDTTLVVCHAPQIGWFARRLTGDSIPIGRAELVCIRLDAHTGKTRGQLEWVLSPSVADFKKDVADSPDSKKDPGDDPEKEIREKIRGKMESAKLLGAVLTGLLTFVIGAPKDLLPPVGSGSTLSGAMDSKQVASSWISNNLDLVICFGGAVIALVAGALLFFAAYFAYDTLLMPTRFWAESRPSLRRVRGLVARPPSSAVWVLYTNMRRVWNWRFVPAVWCAGLAPMLLAYSLMVGRLWPSRTWWVSLLIFGALLLIGGGVARVYGRWTRPIIGAED